MWIALGRQDLEARIHRVPVIGQKDGKMCKVEILNIATCSRRVVTLILGEKSNPMICSFQFFVLDRGKWSGDCIFVGSSLKGFEGMVVRISLYHTKLWYAFGFLLCFADMWIMFARQIT